MLHLVWIICKQMEKRREGGKEREERIKEDNFLQNAKKKKTENENNLYIYAKHFILCTVTFTS